jgi:hypothetical protein
MLNIILTQSNLINKRIGCLGLKLTVLNFLLIVVTYIGTKVAIAPILSSRRGIELKKSFVLSRSTLA